MKLFKINESKVLLSLLSYVWIAQANAGGLILYEIGTPDLGLASAGYAARAQDSATAMTNPAGMTRLQQSELMIGIQPLYGVLEFSPNGNTTVNGNDGGNAVGIFPGGGVFAVYSATSDLKFGTSIYGNFGLAMEFDDGWVGRYYVKEATLLGMTIAPSIAYRVADMWSVGAAFNAMLGILSTTVAVDNSPFALFDRPDGALKVKDRDWGFGGTFGILFEPTETTRFGITYTTDMKLDFEDTIRFTDVLPIILQRDSFGIPIDLGMTVPQSVMASFFHQWNECWAILGNVGWQNWEQFGAVEVEIDTPNPRSATVNLNSKDTWHGALGAQYQFSELWRFSFGTAYDSSMFSDADRPVALPIGQAWRFGVGAQYLICKDFEFGMAYTLIWGGDISIDQDRGILSGRVAGDFDNTAFNYVGVTFRWKY